MLRNKLSIIRLSMFASCMLLVSAFSLAAQRVPTPTSELNYLSVGGAYSGILYNVDGGVISAEVIDEPLGSQFFSNKHLSTSRYENFFFETGFPVSAAVSNWIAVSWLGQEARYDCVVTLLDQNKQAKSARQLSHSVITETTIPACDRSSKEPGRLTVTLSPETVQDVQGSTPPDLGSNAGVHKVWLPNYFKLEIDGLDCTMVGKIDSFTIKQEAGKLVFPNLRVTISDLTAQTWKAWFNDFVVAGNNNNSMEKSGTLTLLAANGVDKLIQINFEHLGIFRLESIPVDANSPMSRMVADLYCEQMIWVPLSGNTSLPATSNVTPGRGSNPGTKTQTPASQKVQEIDKDSPLFTGMPGYFIENSTQNFNSFEFEGKDGRPVAREGNLTHTQYRLKDGANIASPLQISRNYQNAITKIGGEVVFQELDSGGGFTTMKLVNGTKETWVKIWIGASGNNYYIAIMDNAPMEQDVISK